jgi:molybdopterin synthase catalytic subunit
VAVVRVQTGDFDVGAEYAAITSGRTDIGGVGCFVGTVRDSGEGIAALTLEQYPTMTQRALERIAAEAERRWTLLGCTVVHRHGRLLPGANIVLVLAASAHRQPALDATGFLIDWLKTSAPFWKKEEFADGTSRWVDARKTDDEAAARWRA